MLHFILASISIVGFAVSCFGWGRFVLELTHGAARPRSMAFAICLGVATLILLGGFLNVAHLVTTGVVSDDGYGH